MGGVDRGRWDGTGGKEAEKGDWGREWEVGSGMPDGHKESGPTYCTLPILVLHG